MPVIANELKARESRVGVYGETDNEYKCKRLNKKKDVDASMTRMFQTDGLELYNNSPECPGKLFFRVNNGSNRGLYQHRSPQ